LISRPPAVGPAAACTAACRFPRKAVSVASVSITVIREPEIGAAGEGAIGSDLPAWLGVISVREADRDRFAARRAADSAASIAVGIRSPMR